MAKFYEFFAGGGMARAGLGPGWQCLFANDIDPKKAACYAANWGADRLLVGDVAALTVADLPGVADLAWASFPCQDLSLAGVGAGLGGGRSSAFWPFWQLIEALGKEDRAPRLIALENVCGALNSRNGKNFAAIGSALSRNGYRFGAVVINAVHFLPQSRPRLFIIGVQTSSPLALVANGPEGQWHPPALLKAYSKLSKPVQSAWEWWRLPTPPARRSIFADLVEDEPHGLIWHTDAETRKLLGLMNALNLSKVEAAQKAGGRQVGAIYKRTRADGPGGEKVQRAEIRFDGVAGCLRAPVGGSSRQTILAIDGKRIRSRLLSTREAARLMGLPETYALPKNDNDAYRLVGDGLAVPVVRFLAAHLLEPLLAAPPFYLEPSMAILTTTGRAALAAAIKTQTLHLALGEGDPLWDTAKTINAAFDKTGVIELGFAHLADIRVTSLDDKILYALDGDYSANAREGVIRRLPASSIPELVEVTVHFKIAHPPEAITQTALLREAGRRVVDEVHFVTSDLEGEIVVPTGRYRLVASPTNHLFIRVRFDFEDISSSIVREQGLFVGSKTDTELPIGQKFFTPSQIVDPGILLVLQNSVPIVRQPSTRETFEFTVTF